MAWAELFINQELIMEMTQKFLQENYIYSDGKLISVATGNSVGHLNGAGRVQVTITMAGKTKQFYMHRLVFLLHHGYLPKIVDHIDRNPQNNRIENLRAATPSESSCNRVEAVGKSGYTGVDLFSKGRWRAKIRYQNKHIHIGYFDTPEEAHAAYLQTRLELHGEFAPQCAVASTQK
jgi:hypothetical protein